MQVRVRKGADYCHIPRQGFIIIIIIFINKKHLKNVGPIRYCEPPHAHSPDVASGTVVRRLRIVVHDNDDDNDNAWQRGPLWPHGMGPKMAEPLEMASGILTSVGLRHRILHGGCFFVCLSIHPSVCPSVPCPCLYNDAFYGYACRRIVIGSLMLELEPTDQCGHMAYHLAAWYIVGPVLLLPSASDEKFYKILPVCLQENFVEIFAEIYLKFHGILIK